MYLRLSLNLRQSVILDYTRFFQSCKKRFLGVSEGLFFNAGNKTAEAYVKKYASAVYMLMLLLSNNLYIKADQLLGHAEYFRQQMGRKSWRSSDRLL